MDKRYTSKNYTKTLFTSTQTTLHERSTLYLELDSTSGLMLTDYSKKDSYPRRVEIQSEDGLNLKKSKNKKNLNFEIPFRHSNEKLIRSNN